MVSDLYDYITWVLWVFIMSELYSIVSNTYAIKVGEELPEFEVLAIIGGKIRSIFYSVVPPQDNKKDREWKQY